MKNPRRKLKQLSPFHFATSKGIFLYLQLHQYQFLIIVKINLLQSSSDDNPCIFLTFIIRLVFTALSVWFLSVLFEITVSGFMKFNVISCPWKISSFQYSYCLSLSTHIFEYFHKLRSRHAHVTRSLQKQGNFVTL